MKTEKITCDTCGLDLLAPRESGEYRIVLQSEIIGDSDFYDVPQFKEPLHFCGERCFKEYVLLKEWPRSMVEPDTKKDIRFPGSNPWNMADTPMPMPGVDVLLTEMKKVKNLNLENCVWEDGGGNRITHEEATKDLRKA